MKRFLSLAVVALLSAGCSQRDVLLEGRISALETEVKRLGKSLADANRELADAAELRKVVVASASQTSDNTSMAVQALEVRLTKLEDDLPELRDDVDSLGELVDLLMETMDGDQPPSTATTTAPPPTTPAPPSP